MATVRESTRLHHNDTAQIIKPSQHSSMEPREETPTFSRQTAPRPGLGWIATAVIAGGCALATLFFTGWLPREERQTTLIVESNKVKSAAPRVVTVTPKVSAKSIEVLLPSNVQAIRETTLYARTTGYLKRWLVDIGDHVKAGQLLAEIDSPEVDVQLVKAQAALAQAAAALEQSQAGLEQAKAQLVTAQAGEELANLTMKRYEMLRGTNSVTEQDISEKETAVKTAKAAVGASQAAIALAQATINSSHANTEAAQAEVKRLEVLKSFEKVTAPFDGTITARQTEAGSLVMGDNGTGGQALFHIACTDIVRVYVDVPQTYAPEIKAGQSVQVLLREYPTRDFSGKVTRTTGAIDSASRTLQTEVQVPNPTGELMNGMYAQVKLNIVRDSPPLLLPASALIVNAEGTQVAIVREGRVHFQLVVLDGEYGPNIGVSSGLKETDAVIANPGERLVEGIPVAVANSVQ